MSWQPWQLLLACTCWKLFHCLLITISLSGRKHKMAQENKLILREHKVHSLAISSVTSTMWPGRKMKQNIHFLNQVIYCNSLRFSFLIMSLKMSALCLDASLETLQPFCGRCTLRLQEDLLRLYRLLWRFRYAVSSKTAHSLLSRGLRSALPESQFLALMKPRRFLRSHPCVVLAFWAGTSSC